MFRILHRGRRKMTDDILLLKQGVKQMTETFLQKSTPKHPAWNLELERSGGENKWNYVDGLMILSLLEIFKLTGDPQYLRFCDCFMDWFVQEDGSVKTMDSSAARLDDVCGARTFFPLYELTGKEKYRKACDFMFHFLRSCCRTDGGNFWHKGVYPDQVWLDGAYMAMPFYMEYETKLNGMRNYHDLYNQFMSIRKNMRDAGTGLYFHGFDASRSAEWADQATGCSRSFWLRAIGWLAMALTDTLEKMDEQIYYEYRSIESMLKDLVDALLPWQNESGMFYQVVNRPNDERNYLETSGTCMVAYAIMKAARLHLIPERYRRFGETAFLGTAKLYFHRENGEPSLGGICLVGGLGGAPKRDGTPEYYYSEPVVKNEGKGVAPFLLAYAELLQKDFEC